MSVSNGKKSVTLADVAKAAGISKTTASHALSGKGVVSPLTREMVQRLALEMKFEADPLAQRLSDGRSPRMVGLFSLDIDLSSRTRLLQIIQAELNDRGYSVPIYAYGYRGRDELGNQMELMNTLIAQRPRAIVCNTSGVKNEVLERLQRFVDEGGVALCYGYSHSAPVRCDQVVYEEAYSYLLSTRYLTSLGHRDIGAFDVGQRKIGGEQLRSFTCALNEVGAEVRDRWLFKNNGERRYEEDGALLAQLYLGLKQRPTALVIANDYAAVSFVAALHRAGVSVPGEVSVIGHDDDAIAANNFLPLTTVGIPVEEIAERVIEMLSQRLLSDYSGEPRVVVVRGQLAVRQSTAPPRPLF